MEPTTTFNPRRWLKSVNCFAVLELILALILLITAISLKVNGEDEGFLMLLKEEAENSIREHIAFTDFSIMVDLDIIRRVWRRVSFAVVLAWNLADLPLVVHSLILLVGISFGDELHKMQFFFCIMSTILLFVAGGLRVATIFSLDYATENVKELENLKDDSYVVNMKEHLKVLAAIELSGAAIFLVHWISLIFVMCWGSRRECISRQGKLSLIMVALLVLETVLAVIAIALFAVLVKANIPSMTTYSFLTSGEGKLATLVIANLPYPLFGLFGHLWGDFYVWTTTAFAMICGVLLIGAGAPEAALLRDNRNLYALSYSASPENRQSDEYFEEAAEMHSVGFIVIGIILFGCGIADVGLRKYVKRESATTEITSEEPWPMRDDIEVKLPKKVKEEEKEQMKKKKKKDSFKPQPKDSLSVHKTKKEKGKKIRSKEKTPKRKRDTSEDNHSAKLLKLKQAQKESASRKTKKKEKKSSKTLSQGKDQNSTSIPTKGKEENTTTELQTSGNIERNENETKTQNDKSLPRGKTKRPAPKRKYIVSESKDFSSVNTKVQSASLSSIEDDEKIKTGGERTAKKYSHFKRPLSSPDLKHKKEDAESSSGDLSSTSRRIKHPKHLRVETYMKSLENPEETYRTLFATDHVSIPS